MHSPFDDTTPGRLLGAGLQLFSKHGVAAVSIQQICKASGVSVGSAYHHFGNKQDIANALLYAGLADSARQQSEGVAKASSSQEAVKALVYTLIHWIEQNESWAKYIYLVADAAYDAAEEQVDLRQGELYTYLERLIQNGEVKALPLELYASIVVGPTHDCARRYLTGKIDGPLSQYADVLAQIAWESIKR